MSLPAQITAVLGATNTGKTHYAVERMLARQSAVIGLPLRLLAREIYDKVVNIKGVNACALITGEEKIVPPHAQYYVCTVEAMPMRDIKAGKFACVVIDEVQLMGHAERGHIFTDRVLNARGTEETMLLGSGTARPIIQTLVPEARYHNRERFSVLKYAGHEKISRLPKRSVVVAFSTEEVYAIAELIRRQYGGAAVVMGGLSPRTRNAQAAMYQSGEVDYMVATDAIGMGLNLDADHVAFASLRKFDGTRRRYLYAHEIGQIAGRAGRFRQDGTFGTTGSSLPLDDDIVLRIENHEFEPMQSANWRSTNFAFDNAETLLTSLAAAPPPGPLARTAPVMDELVFERLLNTHDYAQNLQTPDEIRQLWDVCQIPDFRNLGLEAHARLLDEIATQIQKGGRRLPDDYMERAIKRLNHIDGAVDILASRLSAIRTWAFIAQKNQWTAPEKNWVSHTRSVEDKLSDALHQKLVQKFVDRRTSVLLKGIGQKTDMDTIIKPTGEVIVEDQYLGNLNGLKFTPSEAGSGLETKTLMAAANLALAPEIDKRLIQIAGSEHAQINLTDEGTLVWNDMVVAKLAPGNTLLQPDVALVGGELGSAVLADQAAGRLRDYMRTEASEKFECLNGLQAFIDDPQTYKDAKPLMRVLLMHHGALRRSHHKDMIKATDKVARGYLRNKGAQFSNFYVFMRELIKPHPARLLSLFFAHAWDKDGGGTGKPFLPQNGMASTPFERGYPEAVLNKAGYTRLSTRFVRFDVLANLEKLIRHAREEDRYGKDKFRIAREMMSALGCGYEDMVNVLKAMGYEPVSYELSEEDFEKEKPHLLKMFNSRKAREAREAAGIPVPPLPPHPETPETKDKKPEAPKKPNLPKDLANPEDKKVHKKRRPVVLNDYYAPPEADENGEPILTRNVDIWQPRTYKPRQKSHTAASDGADISNTEKQKPYAKRPMPRQGKSRSKQDQLSKFADLKTADVKLDPAKRKRRGKHAGKSRETTAPEDSPFAALAALKFSDKKDKKDS